MGAGEWLLLLLLGWGGREGAPGDLMAKFLAVDKDGWELLGRGVAAAVWWVLGSGSCC